MKKEIKNLIRNWSYVFSIFWEIDKKSTFIFCLIIVIYGFVPFTQAYLTKLFLEYLQIDKEVNPNIIIIITMIFIGRYLLTFIFDFLYYEINAEYLEYILRYRIENEISLSMTYALLK